MRSQVYIVGPLGLQNHALSAFLEKETGLTCKSCDDLDLASALGKKSEPRSLVLWDCEESDPETLWTTLFTGPGMNLNDCLVALFNVSLDMEIEKKAVKKGVRGIFYKQVPLEIFAKGVMAIIEGKLWYSRDIMSEFLLHSRDIPESVEKPQVPLSPREREILVMVAAGNKNARIAEQLGIGLRTVKSHLYNIYRKIDVPNRLQASLWALENLQIK